MKNSTKALVVGLIFFFWLSISNRNSEASSPIVGQWISQNSGTKNNLLSVWFLNQTRGFVVGTYGTILKTTNGGKKWQRVDTSTTTTAALRKVSFVNSREGWITPSGSTVRYLLHTEDGGETWHRVPAPFDNFGRQVDNLHFHQFVNENRGWVSARGIWRTDDGGDTWQWKVEGLMTSLINSFYFFDRNVGYLVSDWGTMQRTVNGGDSWQEISGCGRPTETNFNPQSFAFISPQEGWFASLGYYTYTLPGLYHTTNGGKTWVRSNVESTNAIFILDPNNIWVVGCTLTVHRKPTGKTSSPIYYSYDRGKSWREYDSGTTETLNAVFFTDSYHGWVAGNNGVILKFYPPTATRKWTLYK